MGILVVSVAFTKLILPQNKVNELHSAGLSIHISIAFQLSHIACFKTVAFRARHGQE